MKKLFLLVLAAVALVITSGCGEKPAPADETSPTADTSESTATEPAAEAVSTPTYSTSGVPSELTFTREVATTHNRLSGTGILTQNADFKITGFLKEIDPDSNEITRYAQRAFEFSEGQLEWTLVEKDDDGDTKCERITDVSSADREDLSNLNIPVGLTSGATGLSGYDLLLTYNETTAELAVAGKLLVPVEVTDTVIVLGQNAICNGLTATAAETTNDTAVVALPLVWQNVDLDNRSFRGSLIAQEPTGNDYIGTILSGYSAAIFKAPVVVTDITILGDDGPWNVSWDFNFPNLN